MGAAASHLESVQYVKEGTLEWHRPVGGLPVGLNTRRPPSARSSSCWVESASVGGLATSSGVKYSAPDSMRCPGTQWWEMNRPDASVAAKSSRHSDGLGRRWNPQSEKSSAVSESTESGDADPTDDLGTSRADSASGGESRGGIREHAANVAQVRSMGAQAKVPGAGDSAKAPGDAASVPAATAPTCVPCAFFFDPRDSCRNGAACQWCHCDLHQPKRRRRRGGGKPKHEVPAPGLENRV